MNVMIKTNSGLSTWGSKVGDPSPVHHKGSKDRLMKENYKILSF